MASLFIKLLNFCQSDCEKWLSQYSFNLHFSYHEWSWTSFDRFKGNYPFHGEFSTHISWPFFYSIWPFICNTYSPSLQIFLSVYHLSFEFTFLFVMQEFFFFKTNSINHIFNCISVLTPFSKFRLQRNSPMFSSSAPTASSSVHSCLWYMREN